MFESEQTGDPALLLSSAGTKPYPRVTATDGIAPAERERLDRLREKLRDQTAALRQIIEDPQD